MKRNERHRDQEGRLEKVARLNTKKSAWLLGGLAVGAVLLPPAGAAIAASLAAGTGVETIGSKFVHERTRRRRLKKQRPS